MDRPHDLFSSFGLTRESFQRSSGNHVPHKGALRRLDGAGSVDSTAYVISIDVEDDAHVLEYTRKDFEFAQRLFAILDTESRGQVNRISVKEFVCLRCPVFWRRDEDLWKLRHPRGDTKRRPNDSPTFDEIWRSVATCSQTTPQIFEDNADQEVKNWEIGVEGWIVFCRFIALAQYLEAKRRFSARHLQQTMRHRNSPRGSEVIVVEVPPPEPPAPLTAEQLASYEVKNHGPLPLPELDLDHSLLAAHDSIQRRAKVRNKGSVKINLFGSSSFSTSLLNSSSTSKSANSSNLEFAVTFCLPSNEDVVVRRSMADMKWLNSTFASHKVLGGTLCGRILPPFPGSATSPFKKDDFLTTSSIKSTTGGAIEAAAASVGRIRDAAKSFFGSYLVSSSSQGTAAIEEPQPPPVSNAKKLAKQRTGSFSLPDSYYNPNSPAGKARQLERYLNYLLEHPALSTSFSLNAILKASQSGLEGAKMALDNCGQLSKELKAQTPQLDDGGKTLIPFWPMGMSSASTSLSVHLPSFPWVRTAAQAAMALRVHGMLETTGMKSASARLQHASLPSFGTSTRTSAAWDDDEPDSPTSRAANRMEEEVRDQMLEKDNNFEDGVITVTSELCHDDEGAGEDGYDLLPLPVPAPERTILNAGSTDKQGSDQAREGRFHYGTASLHGQYHVGDEDEATSVYLGDVSVDENIDKLREVIGSVDNTLSRCLSSSCSIGKSQRERQNLHLDVVRGLDSWEGMRGQFVSQRSMLKGLAGIEQSMELFEEGGLGLVDNISWQTALANAAVAASEDVRSAVRVARTAASAKATANSAAFAAQNACDITTFPSIEEARAAQTRASIAHSHAIHAAVVDHEAKSVKRRATLALANDVKCWNVHRKREMLRTTMAYARSQHEATRRAVDAWSSLRHGFIGSTVIPSTHERRPISTPPRRERPRQQLAPSVDCEEVTTTIFEDLSRINGDHEPAIVAVDHNLLASAETRNNTGYPGPTMAVDHNLVGPTTTSQCASEASNPFDDPKSIVVPIPVPSNLPFATAAPIEEKDEEPFLPPFGESGYGANLLSLESAVTSAAANLFSTPATTSRANLLDFTTTADTGSTAAGNSPIHVNTDDKITASMQDLVEGLMGWGGTFEEDEDDFALPVGMASSIMLGEEGYPQRQHS